MWPKLVGILRDAVVENWHVKLLSLMLATLLWFLMVFSDQVETTMRYPVVLENLADDLVVAVDVPKAIEVRVRGSAALVSNAADRVHRYLVDLKEVKAGPISIAINPEEIDIPLGMELVQYEPLSLDLEIDHALLRRLQVKPEFESQVRFGYKMMGARATPQTVTLVGAESELVALTVMRTKPIDLGYADASFTREAPLDLDNLHLKQIDARKVRVDVTVGEQTEYRDVPDIPVIVQPADSGISPDPAYLTATLFGPLLRLGKENLANLEFTVNIGELAPGEHDIKPSLRGLPEGVAVSEQSPETVKLIIPEPEETVEEPR